MSEDYSFMKSGFTNEINQQHDIEKQVKELITMYTYNALNTAAIYVEHANRDKITPEDIKRTLMLEIFLFTNRNVEQDIIDFKNKIFLEMEPIIQDKKEDSDTNDEEEEEEEEEEVIEFCESQCKCAMCVCITNIYTRWESFTPGSPIENLLKERIDEM
jgi:hypothetical protein